MLVLLLSKDVVRRSRSDGSMEGRNDAKRVGKVVMKNELMGIEGGRRS